ncbi:MAG: hypothetical protein K9W46_02265 [Candidatus Heimdallarchaeum endolithica]|uniref:Uncharacterized protein n=1 Tax=Candidatus Heimdallarchaeum endolithica TaxID=2876572 RepID=A0A9Y1BS14_9ARCH|nr:MAG: hypothetical protein K9W46_02265 [Candidatus Heimdallarchaeum endolithica]
MNRQIEYQCNQCKKLRMLLISDAIELKSFMHDVGTIEFVDVHECINNKIKASLLYVDTHHKVRSQWIIEAEENGYSDAKLGVDMSIPVTPKADLPKIQIVPTSDFGSFNLKGFKIKDKLRQCYFLLNENSKGEKIKAISPLKFIEFEATIAPEIDKKIAELWIKRTAKLIESVPILEEIVITFLPSYLDNFITFEPKEREINELELLFNSPISVIYTSQNKKSLFQENWKTICPDIGSTGYRMYYSILRECADELEKSIIDVYFQIGSQYTFPYFLASINELISLDLICFEKFEFVTIKQPDN